MHIHFFLLYILAFKSEYTIIVLIVHYSGHIHAYIYKDDTSLHIYIYMLLIQLVKLKFKLFKLTVSTSIQWSCNR